MDSCIYIPKHKNKDSKLFSDLMSITKDRDTTIALYGLSKSKELMDNLNIREYYSNGEPKASALIDALGKPKEILGEKNYIKFIEDLEGLSNTYSSYSSAYEKFNSLTDKYDNEASFYIHKEGNSFKISAQSLSNNNPLTKNTVRNSSLRSSILSYLNNLGFDIEENSTVDNPSRFSPLEATENANKLKVMIRMAKDYSTSELTEEFSHLMIEGLHNHPLVQRLLNTITDDVIRDTLGDQYEEYVSKYDNNEELLKKEAAGKILSEAIMNNSFDNPLLERIRNVGYNKISKGNTSDIDSFIALAEEAANELATFIASEDSIKFFDRDYIVKAPTLYHIKSKGETMKNLSEKSYQLLNKKMKIEASKEKNSNKTYKINAELDNIKALIEKKDYATSCFSFLNFAVAEIEELSTKIADSKTNLNEDDIPLITIKKVLRVLRRMKISMDAYIPILTEFTSLKSREGIQDELTEEDIQDLTDQASDVLRMFNEVLDVYKETRYTAVFKFLEYYIGDEKLLEYCNSGSKVNIEDVLHFANGDMMGVARIFNSMEDASDSLVSIVDSVIKKQLFYRDKKLQSLLDEVMSVHKQYVESTGSRDTSFMIEKDENGVPTGMIISDRDYAKFYNERNQKIKEWQEAGLTYEEVGAKLSIWDNNHTEIVQLDEEFKERLPKKSLYPSNNLDNLTKEQLNYYKKMMQIKMRLDRLLPVKYVKTFRAIQKRDSSSDIVFDSNLSTSEKVKKLYDKTKSQFTIVQDDTSYGEIVNEDGSIQETHKGKNILLDFSGNPVKKVPIFYTSRLEDMSALSTNFTDSLVSYATMAVNYSEMSKISDALEVIKDLAAERKVKQFVGTRRLYESFKYNGEEFSSEYLKEGKDTTAFKALEQHIDKALYHIYKDKETINIGGKEVNYGKIGDIVKQYSTLVGMGYSTLSGLSNVTMGGAQLLIEATGGEFFNLKDLAKAQKIFFENLPDILKDAYSDYPQTKIGLIFRYFDVEEDFYNEASDTDSSKSAYKKVMSSLGPLCFNNMGEKYLHGVLLISMLNHIKLKNSDKSLWDALDVKDVKTKSGTVIKTLDYNTDEIILKDTGKRDESGNKIYKEFKLDSNLLYTVRKVFKVTSHRLNGAYNDIDKGQIGSMVLGRLLTQFRQWMPAYIMNRFKSSRFNAELNREEEGFYITLYKFLWNEAVNIKNAKFNIASHYNQLTSYQKSNIKKAISEISLFYILKAILSSLGVPDKDDSNIRRVLTYLGYRLKSEIGALCGTLNLDAWDNIKTLIKSPLPAMEGVDRVIGLLNISNMFDTIESGKFKDWTVWNRDLFYAIPYARNISRAVGLVQGDNSIFNPFK